MSATDPRPMRADARRNRAAILEAARVLFAERGGGVQMEELAERAGLGMGTLYRHFATKRALLSAIVGERFGEMIELARAAAKIDGPGHAFTTLLRSYLEAAERDQAFRLAVLGPETSYWDDLAGVKAQFSAAAEPVMARAVAAGCLRADFTLADFVHVTRGVMVNMSGDGDTGWRRHLVLALEGLSPDPRV